MLADNPADDGGLGGNSKSTTSIAQELIGFVTQSFWHSWTALLTAMVLFPSQMTGKPHFHSVDRLFRSYSFLDSSLPTLTFARFALLIA